ncbi:MAG TPA: DUF885 domain-containing protein, partial [Bacteroidia bacterium]|nr:DUF885 domain-containing protein [Bacteroidia bacterium]
MKKALLTALISGIIIITVSCQHKQEQAATANPPFSGFLQQYYDQRMELFPFEATANGDNRFNDRMPIEITIAYHNQMKSFYEGILQGLSTYHRDSLSREDRISYDILEWESRMGLEGLEFPDQLIPINQFWSLPLTLAQLGSGQSNQPFHTVIDYDNWLKRAGHFSEWCDTAIANMRIGIKEGYTLTNILAERVVPQMSEIVKDDITQSVYYMPISNLPDSFSADDKSRLDSAYRELIKNVINPSYQKLYVFFRDEYVPACRTTTGISELPGGKERYAYLAKYWTTTTLSPDSIFNLGMSEVKRLRSEMEVVMKETGYKGDLRSFFNFLNTDKRFFPYKKPQEILDAFNHIYEVMKPQLSNLFDQTPRSAFEVRQTEKFREASASAEYNPGTADGSRPGIFYVPIPDAAKFNTFGMEDLFLHEAIPGHHFQNMLSIENDSLPMFRRFIWYGAYGEGWALYTESLGKELGLYKDPYQYVASLSEEMHRAIRLVVDVGMHLKG